MPTDIFESKPLSKNQIISELKNMYENEVMEYFLQLVNNFELKNKFLNIFMNKSFKYGLDKIADAFQNRAEKLFNKV